MIAGNIYSPCNINLEPPSRYTAGTEITGPTMVENNSNVFSTPLAEDVQKANPRVNYPNKCKFHWEEEGLGKESAMTWSDFEKPWEAEIRIAGPGIEPWSSRMRKQETSEKTRRLVALSGTIPTCENSGAAPPEIKPGSLRWEASSLPTTSPRPRELMRVKRGEYGAAPECYHVGNGKNPRKLAKQRYRRHELHMRKSGGGQPGIEPGSPWWEASNLTTTSPWPLFKLHIDQAFTSVERPPPPKSATRVYITPARSGNPSVIDTRGVFRGTTAWERHARLPPRQTGFNPRPVNCGFSQVRIVQDDAIGRWDSPGSPVPPPLHSDAAPYSPHSTSSALNTSLLRAAQISSLTHSL
ncbi:hypothetical protein PR048_032086 [Dryococelus australis]|uniref:Uncharacterized protein n=1 Tax=Dryococelus australis TaxID=614101 RepID=A0ABQ9G178_9NEOP|nr:hypothetical protein PR048_032086 [Dryococelus australis]